MFNRKAYGALLLQMVLIGLSFMFIKIALEYTTPLSGSLDGAFDILGHRFTLAFIAALIPILFDWVKLSITPKGWLLLLPLSLLYPLLFFTFQTLGIANTTTAEAGIVFAASPIFVAIIAALLLKERTTLLQKGSILLSVSGVLYIIMMKGELAAGESYNYKGIIYTLLSALATGFYTVLVRKYRNEYSNYTLMFLMMLIGFIIFNIIALTDHGLRGTLIDYFSPLASFRYFLSVFYVGVLSTFVTQFLAIYAVARIEASKVGVFNNLATVVTIFAGVLFLGEQLYSYHIVGAIIIIAGIIGSNYFAKQR